MLNIAYNMLCGGRRLEDIETAAATRSCSTPWGRRRCPIRPRPATSAAGSTETRHGLAGGLRPARLKVWSQQPAEFFAETRGSTPTARSWRPTRRVQAGHRHLLQRRVGLPAAGGLAGQHRRGAAAGQPRRATGPSHEGVGRCSTSASRCAGRPGFSDILLRGDTDFSLTSQLDRWDARRGAVHVRLRRRGQPRHIAADDLPQDLCQEAGRPRPSDTIQTQARARPPRTSKTADRRRAAVTRHATLDEEVAEFAYRPARLHAGRTASSRSARTSRSSAARTAVRRRTATSSTSPTTGSSRPRRSCSRRPTTAATRRT